MRSPVTQVLPAKSSLQVRIEPPLTEREQPFVITVRGAQSIVIRVLDSGTVSIENPTDGLSPFFFFVGPRSLALAPGWIQAVARLLGGS